MDKENRKELDALLLLIKKSLVDLYKYDIALFERETCERSKVFHMTKYMCKYIKRSRFKKYNIDYEYNRNINEVKKMEVIDKDHKLTGVNIYPDVIIHKRGTNENLLVIEVKCDNSNDRDGYKNDIVKLKNLTKKENGQYTYSYKWGMHIVLDKDKKSTTYDIFYNGEKVVEGKKIF